MTRKETLNTKLVEYIKQLDDVEFQAIVIMMESMTAGETHQEAAEKAAAFMRSQGREKQAQRILDTAKTFVEGARQ